MEKGEPMEIENQIKSDSNSEDLFWWLKFVPQLNTWTNVNIFRFLRIYKTYPVLWDPKNSKYSKLSERSQAYREISKELNLQGVHEKECMKLVESLKEIFIEEKKKREEAKSCKQKYKPPPVWFQVLNDIVESVINNQKVEAKSSIENNMKNEMKKEQIKELINCMKTYTDNIWTPNYLKTEVWKSFLPKTQSYITDKKEKSMKENYQKSLSNEDIDQSCEALKLLEPKYCPDHNNIVCDCSSHSIQNMKNYCPNFPNISCDCSSHSQSIQSEKKYCPELKNILCNCSSESLQNGKKYCPELTNLVCNCSSESMKKVKKYCPEFKNIICDCLSQCSQNIKKYCPEFKNIICDCLSQTSQNTRINCPELENILCNCSSHSIENVKKYCPEYKDIICDCSSSTKITEYSDSRIQIQKVATPLIFTMPKFNKKKYDNPYMVLLDRYCYYKNFSEYYKCKICDSVEHYQEFHLSEKNSEDIIFNKKPPRPHKNNTVFESEINIFSDMKRHYPLQLFDCMEQENLNFVPIK